jgi:hypothetical protein
LQDKSPPKPNLLELLKQIRRATNEDQLYVLNWLLNKFGDLRIKK